MDIDIKSEEGTFKARACGVVVEGNKILTLKANWGDAYVFPGGHIEMGETSQDAVVREMLEELQVPVKVKGLLCVHENVYRNTNGKIANEIAFYYEVIPTETLPKENFERHEIDHGVAKTQRFCWVDIFGKESEKIRPSCVPQTLQKQESKKICLTKEL